MRTRPIAIKVRLASWYFVITAIAVSALGALALAGMEHSIRTTVDEQLADRMRLINRLLLTYPEPQTTLQDELRESVGPDSQEELVQILDERGGTVFESTWLQNRPLLSAEGVAHVRKKRRPFFDAKVGGVPFRGMSAIVGAGTHHYSVQVAQNMDDFAEATTRFRHLLLAIIPALLMVASLGGYWISSRALAPVDEITRAAQEISGRNLSARLAVPGSGDELARLAETLNAMLERIDSGLKQIAQFTADASHELRTPVALMRTRAELSLRRPRTAEESRETIEHLHREIVRTSELVDRLMLLARADSGTSLLQSEAVELVQLVREVCDETSVLAEQRQLGMEARIDGSEIWVAGDARYLRQLLLILIDNAVKYTPAPGQITVTLGSLNGRVRLAVGDTGIGMEATDLEHIFERFYRADKARSRETGGAGLGLSIGRWIAEAHNGTLRASSEIGSGSSFVVELPLATENSGS